MPAAKKKTAKGAANIVAFLGTDEAQVKEAAAKTYGKLLPEDAGDFGGEIIDGGADNAEHAGRICSDVIQALQTLPFFGGQKIVWLKNANFLGDSVTGRAAASLDGQENILELLKAGLPDEVIFIISATEIDKRRAFYKGLSKIGRVTVFDKPDTGKAGWEGQVMELVESRARELGVKFDKEALELFVMLVGEDTMQIRSELEKMSLYLGDQESVKSEDVRKLVSLTRAGVVFEVGNAIGRRDLRSALEMVDHLMFRGESAVGILLAAIVPKVRNLVVAKDLAERGIGGGSYQSFMGALERMGEAETAHLPRTKAGKLSAYPLYLALGETRKFSSKELREALHSCLEANERLVTTQIDPKLVLNQLLVKILARRK